MGIAITIEIIEKFDAYENGLNTKESLAARRVRVSEMNAQNRAMQTANHALEIIGRAAGSKGIARNAARVYAKQGLTIDMRDAFDQGDFFDPDEPAGEPDQNKGGDTSVTPFDGNDDPKGEE